MGLLACLATSNFKRSLGKLVSQTGCFRSPAPKVRMSADSWRAEGASLESCCSALSAHGTVRTEAQRMGLLAYLATSNFKRILGKLVSQPCTYHSPAPKVRTSADSWQAEGAILESCCSALSAHGTVRTEAQRMGLLACLATSNFKRSLGMVVSQPGFFRSPAPKERTSADSLQPEGASLERCCSASSAHGTARTEAQRLWMLVCLPTSNFKRSREWDVPATLRLEPCSEDANVCR